MNGVFTDQQISLAISDLGLGDVRAMLVTLIYGPVLTLLGPLSDLHMYTSYSHRTYGHTGTDGKRERWSVRERWVGGDMRRREIVCLYESDSSAWEFIFTIVDAAGVSLNVNGLNDCLCVCVRVWYALIVTSIVAPMVFLYLRSMTHLQCITVAPASPPPPSSLLPPSFPPSPPPPPSLPPSFPPSPLPSPLSQHIPLIFSFSFFSYSFYPPPSPSSLPPHPSPPPQRWWNAGSTWRIVVFRY